MTPSSFLDWWESFKLVLPFISTCKTVSCNSRRSHCSCCFLKQLHRCWKPACILQTADQRSVSHWVSLYFWPVLTLRTGSSLKSSADLHRTQGVKVLQGLLRTQSQNRNRVLLGGGVTSQPPTGLLSPPTGTFCFVLTLLGLHSQPALLPLNPAWTRPLPAYRASWLAACEKSRLLYWPPGHSITLSFHESWVPENAWPCSPDIVKSSVLNA